MSCHKEKEADYFNGDIQLVEFTKEKDLKGTFIELDEVYAYGMLVYDSLLIGGSGENTYGLNVFGLNSRKKLGMICRLGEGPDDFRMVSTSGKQFEKVNDDICLWIGDGNSKYVLVNITASLRDGRTVVVKQYDHMPGRKYWSHGFGVGYILENDLILTRTQCESDYQSDKDYEPTCYHLYKGDIEHHVKDYTLYNKAIYSMTERFANDEIYNTVDVMRPDKKKLAMAMPLVGQLNIMDIETGKQTGYRLKDSYDLDYIPSHDMYSYKEFFQNISADQQYIYISYINKPIDSKEEDGSHFRNAETLKVFDWEGTPIITLHLDNKFRFMSFDPVHKMFYLTNYKDELYRYDMNFLYN